MRRQVLRLITALGGLTLVAAFATPAEADACDDPRDACAETGSEIDCYAYMCDCFGGPFCEEGEYGALPTTESVTAARGLPSGGHH